MAEQGAKNVAGFFENVKRMADELGLEGEERDNFIDRAMEKKGGHKKLTTWVPDDGKSGGDSGRKDQGWFA